VLQLLQMEVQVHEVKIQKYISWTGLRANGAFLRLLPS
jgi:hypothetical protein